MAAPPSTNNCNLNSQARMISIILWTAAVWAGSFFISAISNWLTIKSLGGYNRGKSNVSGEGMMINLGLVVVVSLCFAPLLSAWLPGLWLLGSIFAMTLGLCYSVRQMKKSANKRSRHQ